MTKEQELNPKNIKNQFEDTKQKSSLEENKIFKDSPNKLDEQKDGNKLDEQKDENKLDEQKDENKLDVKDKDLTLEEKNIELEDKLARTFAEMENQRRRFEKEKEDAFEYGGFAFAKEALTVIDNLDRSKQVLENDENLKNTEALKKSLEHLEVIKKDLISVFLKNDIKPIECINKKLDPNLHQAMMEIENDEKEPGTILQEIQKGFTIKDRLLRPSLVGVCKKTVNKGQKNTENKDNSDDK